jgi:alcohol dehydrogenase
MAASALGAGEIIAVARDAGRLERVRAVNPGIVVPVSMQDDPELGALRARTGGRGADVYVDCLPSGGIAVTQRCLLGLRAGGRAVLIGGVVGSLELPYRYFMNQEIEVTGSVGFGRGNFDRIVRLVEAGVVDFSGFVTHRFPLAQANDAIAAAVEKTGDPLGVIVQP